MRSMCQGSRAFLLLAGSRRGGRGVVLESKVGCWISEGNVDIIIRSCLFLVRQIGRPGLFHCTIEHSVRFSRSFGLVGFLPRPSFLVSSSSSQV